MLLIALPGGGIMLLRNGADVLKTSRLNEKLLLIIWYFLNVAVNLAHLFAIHYLFRYR